MTHPAHQQINRDLLRPLMQERLDACPLRGLPVVVLLGPLRLDFDNQSFAIRIKFVGHELV